MKTVNVSRLRWASVRLMVACLGICFSGAALSQETAPEHPAITLFKHVTKEQRDPAFWQQKLELASAQSVSQYPCPSKTIPAVNQLMLSKIIEQQASDQFQFKVSSALERAMNMNELRELNEYYDQTQSFSDVQLTYTREKLGRIKRNLRKTGEINARETRVLERNVMRETRRELSKILSAYANPDGSCR